MRDLIRGEDPQIASVLAVLADVDADVVLLQSVDYDLNGEAISRLAQASGYPHAVALRPNSGRPSGLDIDGDGRLGEPEDALGYGAFSGQGGMALLSRLPFNADAIVDHGAYLWRDLPGNLLPDAAEGWPSADVRNALPLASVGHFEVPLQLPDGLLTLFAFHAAPPVFDGPEDRNGRRNHDQIVFWQHRLDGSFGAVPDQFVLIGDANQDPNAGEGRKAAIRALLSDTRLQDPQPQSPNGLLTVDWTDVDAGVQRVSYILPASGLRVVNSGVVWPDPPDPLAAHVTQASRHRLVWVDLDLGP